MISCSRSRGTCNWTSLNISLEQRLTYNMYFNHAISVDRFVKNNNADIIPLVLFGDVFNDQSVVWRQSIVLVCPIVVLPNQSFFSRVDVTVATVPKNTGYTLARSKSSARNLLKNTLLDCDLAVGGAGYIMDCKSCTLWKIKIFWYDWMKGGCTPITKEKTSNNWFKGTSK